jgi:vacuolar protein sorting-associated protein VTA1
MERPTIQDRNGSMGGGYFPEVPTFTSDARPSTLETAPSVHMPGDISPPDLLDLPQKPDPSGPRKFDSFTALKVNDETSIQPQNLYRTPPPHQHQNIPRQVSAQSYAPPAAIVPQATPSFQKQSGFIADDLAMAKAQKHARFAISALTFDDPDTAVKELRAALQTLGAN